MWWLFLIIGFVFAYFLLALIILIWGFFRARNCGHLPCHCNDCKITFMPKAKYKYCPFCGKELTYHDEYIKYMEEVE